MYGRWAEYVKRSGLERERYIKEMTMNEAWEEEGRFKKKSEKSG
jgi:hypothetical protein